MLKSKSQTIRKSAPAYEAGRKEKRQPVEWEEHFGGLDLEIVMLISSPFWLAIFPMILRSPPHRFSYNSG